MFNKKFDIVTFLITLAGKIQVRRHEKLVALEKNLEAAAEAINKQRAELYGKKWNAHYRSVAIKGVK